MTAERTGPVYRPFTIYRSSAGSGKTYTLAREYLLLALRNPDQFGQILAITFTNKATREMKDRILAFLMDLRAGKAPELATFYCNALKIGVEVLQERAFRLLGNILHRYDEFAVSTIDAFFQRIVRAFARELGLLGSFGLELDEEKVLQIAVDLTIDSAGSDKRLRDWLAELVDRNLDEGRSWDIRGAAGQLAREVFGERFKSFEEQIITKTGDGNGIPEFLNGLKKAKAIYENQLKEQAAKGSALIAASGLSIDDFKWSDTGPAGFFEKVLSKPGDPPGTRVTAALENSDEWATKKSDRRERIIGLAESGLMTCLQDLVAFLEQNRRRYNSVVRVMGEIYNFGILADIAGKVAQYRTDEDVMLISDINQFLLKIVDESPAPFVYEKTGARYRHFLIDEFQDTSGFQWECLRPLVLNSLAENQANMVVGDVKQSIYRWRGGDWNLLANKLEGDIPSPYIKKESLTTNWRSSGRIVHFNNRLFDPESLPGLLGIQHGRIFADVESDETRRTVDDFARLYADARQEMPSAAVSDRDRGCVRIEFSEEIEDRESWYARILDRLPFRIQQLLSLGYRCADIAILVRRKTEGAEVVKRLIAFRNEANYLPQWPYEVVSNESLLLANAPVLRLLVHTLQWLNRPDDRLALVNLACDFTEVSSGAQDELSGLLKNDTEQLVHLLPEALRNGGEPLRSMALPQLIEHLIRVFRLESDPAHLPWLQAFQDAVLRFSDEYPQDLSRFLEWWAAEASRLALQTSGELDALRVMTIHKAKGLEFRAVLIPFCRWSLDHGGSTAPVLWCSSDLSPLDRMPFFPVRYSRKLAGTLFAGDYLEEYGKVLLDNLNLLYVAFTRARDLLWVDALLPKPDKKGAEKINDVSGALHLALTRMQQDNAGTPDSGSFDDSGHIYQHGDFAPVVSTVPAPEILRQDHYFSSAWSPRIRIRHRSLFRPVPGEDAPAESLRFGLLVHELLGLIRTPSHLPGQIAALQRDGRIGAADVERLRPELDRVLAIPGMDDWFAPDCEVWAETPILLPGGQSLRPDRVVRRNGRVSVIDFKTGKRSEEHLKQIKLYRDVLAQMMTEPVTAFLVYTNTGTVIQTS